MRALVLVALLAGCSGDSVRESVVSQEGSLTITSEQSDGVRHGTTTAVDPTGHEVYRIEYDHGQIVLAVYSAGRVTRFRESADYGLTIQQSPDPTVPQLQFSILRRADDR